MKVIVTVVKELDEFWAEIAQFEAMSDADIIEMLQDDLVAFVDGATWAIERQTEPDVDAATGTADDAVPGSTVQAIDDFLRPSPESKASDRSTKNE
jgi:hypothetical protein